MIDSDFIIKYTNALYSTDTDIQPEYSEFRDMFSSGQIKSKEWAIKELKKSKIEFSSATILGCWYGTLGLLLKREFPTVKLSLVDIDPRCEKFNEKIFYDVPDVKLVTADMFEYFITEDLVINTSCEHIHNIDKWIDSLPKGTQVLLQSNNYYAGNGHVDCSGSLNHFIEKTNLNAIVYSGELIMPMYTRYMIIGRT